VEVKSTIRILSASSVGSCRCDTCSWTTVVACFSVSLLHRGATSLGGGLPSTDLRSLPLMRAPLLKGEAGIWLWHRHPRWNRHHGLSGQSVLHPWCGCDSSGRSPRAVPPGGGEVGAPSPLDSMRNFSAESSIMADHRTVSHYKLSP
jgi:hypothetical protein